MAHMTESNTDAWTAVDLVQRFGAIPLSRIRLDPPPGSARETDVVAIHDRENRLYELVDGVLVEKTMGTYESYLAMLLGRLLGNYVAEKDLGIVLGADGMLAIAPGLVRIPDVSFVPWSRLPGRRVPRAPVAAIVPDLAVEVISRGNTREEMERKLDDYFAAGVRQVWFIHHAPRREVHVYLTRDRHAVVREGEFLDGGEVLPGFRLAVEQLFHEPGE